MNKYTFFMHLFYATLFTVTGATLPVYASSLESTQEVLASGDLIFIDFDCGLCEAIEDVTMRQWKVKAPRLSHVAMIFWDKKQDAWLVYEANTKGVQKSALKVFWTENINEKTKTYVMRPPLKQREVRRIQKWMEKQMGTAYDEAFLINNQKYYCSEFILEAFQAVQKQPFFGYTPMYFGDLANKEDRAAQVWIKYFKELGNVSIPQHQPGISPLGIYLNPALTEVKTQKIIHQNVEDRVEDLQENRYQSDHR